MKSLKPYLAILCALLVGIPLLADEPVSLKTGGDARFLGRWQSWTVAPVNLSNTGRLESLVRAGKIYLSLQDAIALALENNIDIEIQRYAPQLAAADVLRAQSGSAIRGVNTVVSGGQAGATGQSQTNTQSSLVSNALNGVTATSSAGPATASLDPVLLGNLRWGHVTSPQTSAFITGTNSLVQTSKLYNFTAAQSFLTGTTAQMGFNNSFLSQNSFRADFNPVTQANAEIIVSQHLLQGFGVAINNRFIKIAKNNVKVANLTFEQQVISTVSNVVGLYYDLVSFNEDVTVRRQALALAEKLYNDNRKQVEIGTLAPIEIVRAEAEVASRQQDLTTSETNVLQQETIIKNALSRTGVASPTITDVRIVPTDRISIPATEAIQPVQDLVQQALERRPELTQSQVQLENSRISLKGTKNALLPTLDAYVDVANGGLAGSVNGISTPGEFSPTGQPIIRDPNAVDGFFVGGYGTALSQLFRRNFPNYTAGLQLNIPLRNRAAQADYATAQLNLRQNELLMQRQVNGVRVDVQNALIALQQARARYTAAEKNRALQEQTLDAEQKKYALGASTVFMVIQAQRDLATAEGSKVAALAAYARAKTQLEYATGQILPAYNISIEEATQGKVSRPPSAIPVLDPGGRGGSK
jgi:outer membrane protein